MNRLTIHQPDHLPYSGFISKVLLSDIYVVLDHVQYKKNNFQNRNKIINAEGQEVWLTIPLEKSSYDTPINKKIISKDKTWKVKYINKLSSSYAKFLNFNYLFPKLENIILSNDGSLIDINLKIINFLLRDIFEYEGQIILSSTLDIKTSKSDLNLDICKAVSATQYISGPSGRNYLDKKSFGSNKIELKFIDYKPVDFTNNVNPYISILDPLMRYEFLDIKSKIIANSNLCD